jgi:cleavage and polyadenylation specificity factor subunit 1
MESQVGYGLGEEEEGPNLGGIICARIESSYVMSLRDLDIKFVKDFVFLHGKPSLPTHH